MVRRRRGGLWSLGAAALAGVTTAFDIDAHDAIGQTTASAMDPQATKEVKRLMNGQDTSDVAGWGHQVDDTYPGMERLHFQVHDDAAEAGFCGKVESRVAKCEDNICLVTAIKHFYGKVLAAEGRKTDYPQIDYDKAAKGVKFSDVDSVKMLINLMGDLHQPMHLGYFGDDMGRKVKLRFRGKEVSLYDFWDKTISETVRNEESNFWLGGWTHARAIMPEFNKDKELWKSEGAFKMFDRWAEETVQFACDKAYLHPSKKNKLAGPDAKQEVIEISEGDYRSWREVWLRQILLAGERTAVVLNDILDAKGATKLHEGTGVKTKVDEEKDAERKEWEKEAEDRRKKEVTKTKSSGRSSSAGPWIVPSVLMTNFAIACVVVPAFIYVVEYGPSFAGLMAALRNMAEAPPAPAASAAPGTRAAKKN